MPTAPNYLAPNHPVSIAMDHLLGYYATQGCEKNIDSINRSSYCAVILHMHKIVGFSNILQVNVKDNVSFTEIYERRD